MIKKVIQTLVLLSVVTGLVGAYVYYGIFQKSINTENKETVYFYIKSSDGLPQVIENLVEKGIVQHHGKFEWLAKLRNLEGNIYPGRYTLKKDFTWTDLVLYFRQGKIDEVTVTFNNVRTLDQLAKSIAAQIEATEDELIKELVNEESVNARGYQKETFLSVFIPNTYKMYWNTSAKQFVDRMLKEHSSFWTEDRLKKARALNLSTVEISTLASIVQSEQAKFSQEWTTIAGLYINRLRRGIKLQSDPTVVYAWGDFSIRRVWNKHLTIDNPYNTYRYAGLPPGPIRVPSSKVIDAVLNFKKHDYIFMCAKADNSGLHAYAKTNAEHNRNANLYRAYLNKQKIK